MKISRQLRNVLVMSSLFLGVGQNLFAASSNLSVSKSDLRGTFSDICAHPQTGDLIGTEVSFIPTASGPVVLFQQAEGVLLKPVLLVPKSSASNRVEVQDAVQGGVAFTAELKSANELILKFKDGQVSKDGSSSAMLRRRLAVWSDQRKVAACR